MAHRWTARTIRARAVVVLKEEGIRSLFFRVLGETVYRRAIVAEFLLNDPAPMVVLRLPVHIDLLQTNQIEDYLRFRPDADRLKIQHRLDQKQWCFAAWYQNRIVGASWVTARSAKVEYLARHADLSPDELYVYETLTLPKFRRVNIASAIGVEICRVMRAAGYRRIWVIVVPENKPGLQLHLKKGYRRIGTMGYMKIGPWQRNFERWDHPAPPNALSGGVDYWGDVMRRLEAHGHYLDTFLAEMKKRAYLTLIANWGDVPKTGYILKTDLFEEASGSDSFLFDLRRNRNQVIGIDISHEVVRRTKSRNITSCGSYVVADARNLPFSTNTFGFIISPSTLDHFENPSDLHCGLRELARILAPKGRAVVTLDNKQNVFDPILRLANRLNWLPFYVGSSCTIRELRAALELAGLQVHDTTAILHNPRLVSVGAISLARRIGWQPLIGHVQRALIAAQKLGETPWRYYTGSFIAALAVKPGNINASSD